MLNLRGAMVPTDTLIPRIEAVDQRSKWKIVGVWKKRPVSSSSSVNGDDDEEDDDRRLSRLRRQQQQQPSGSAPGGIHDMDIGAPMPSLSSVSEGSDLENIPPVRIETWMVKVFHYASDADVTMDRTVLRKMFCVLTVTPVRNLNLAEYLRHSIVENTQVRLSAPSSC